MRVLVFTSLYPNNVWPHHGVFVKERMTQFARLEGCSVRVVAPVPYFPPIKISARWRFSQVRRQELIEGIEVYHPRYVMTPKIGMALYGVKMALAVLPLVQRLRRTFDFDLIDAHFVYPDGFAAVLLGMLCQRPVVISARGSDINRYARMPLIRPLLRYALRQAAGVIAVSQALKTAITGLGVVADRVAVIPNGVDAGKFYPCASAEARRQLALPQDRTVLLSVGGLIPEKGFDILLKALKILVEEYHRSDLYLVIVGAGAFRGELEKMIASLRLQTHVRLAGAVPHHELYLWYNAADIFCLASSREGWPNVVLEALACGRPVVATPVGGIPEILCSAELGLLTQRSDRDVAQGILQALDRVWDTSAIVRYARARTWEDVARSVLQVFSAALHDRGPAVFPSVHSSPSGEKIG